MKGEIGEAGEVDGFRFFSKTVGEDEKAVLLVKAVEGVVEAGEQAFFFFFRLVMKSSFHLFYGFDYITGGQKMVILLFCF